MTFAPDRVRQSSIEAVAISGVAFAPFGDLIEVGTVDPAIINDGRCRRFTDLACLDAVDGRIGISLFKSEIQRYPYRIDLLERHPLGSQCFIPLGASSYLVVVAHDRDGAPDQPIAFSVGPDQSVNIARNIWHGVLAPTSGMGLFAVLDRIGAGRNLEERRLEEPILIMPHQAKIHSRSKGPTNG